MLIRQKELNDEKQNKSIFGRSDGRCHAVGHQLFRLDNCNGASMSFVVVDPGIADFVVSYEGNATTFVHAKLTVTFEKRFLGVFWRTVDIGTTNNEWVAFNGDLQGDFYDYVTMDGTGTYRANFKLEILGIDGSIDVIEESIDCRYSG